MPILTGESINSRCRGHWFQETVSSSVETTQQTNESWFLWLLLFGRNLFAISTMLDYRFSVVTMALLSQSGFEIQVLRKLKGVIGEKTA